MNQPPEPPVNRNAPCPCGSGKKYKQCCGAKSSAEPEAAAPAPAARNLRWPIILGMLGLFAAAVILLNVFGPDRAPPPTEIPAASPGGLEGTPPAWYYDVANDRHWDPGHNHWHQGPPPSSAEQQMMAPPKNDGSTPPAGHYDAENNRHWNADHGHWHDGPPPAGD